MTLISDLTVLRTKEVFNNVWPLLYPVRYYCKQRPIKYFFNVKHILLSIMLCEGNLHRTYHLHKMLFLCYCKRVFLPESSWCRRLAAVEGLLCADFPCARNGARLWKTSPQVLHTYSRWAARRSWTCFTFRFKASIRLNFRPLREHSCRFPRTA